MRSIKYALGTKIVAALLIWISTIGIIDSGIFLINNVDMIRVDSYYDTYEYQGEISRLIHNVVELNTRLIDEEHIRNSIFSMQPSSEKVQQDENTKQETATQDIRIERQIDEYTTEEIILDPQIEGHNVVLNDVTVAIDDEEKERLVKEKLSRLAKIRNNLSRTVNFNYYIKNTQTGEITTNLHSNTPLRIQNQPNSLYIDRYEIPYFLHWYDDIQKMLIEKPHEVYVSINEPLEPGDNFYTSFATYSRAKKLAPYAVAVVIGSIVLFLIAFGYLIAVCGREEKDGEIVLMEIDKIYNDIQSLFVLFAAGISISIFSSINFSDFNKALIFGLIILSIDIFIGMVYFFSMLRQFKKGILFKNTLVYKVFKKVITVIFMFYDEKIFKRWILGLLLLYGFINSVLFAIAISSNAGFVFGSVLMVIFNGIVLSFAFKGLQSLHQIMEAAKEISNGNLDYRLDKSQMSVEFSNFAENIENIQGGLKNAVYNAIKSERMKTDLITNVSHDLKTPLTSIINYVDLLKQEEIQNIQATEYITILDDKSERLKQLIEDLIEASKASSGNLTINKEQVDLHELIVQACGEYEEKTKAAQLDVRINTAQEKTFVLADGKYMWRIVENLMSNVLKYSMAGSRVYIDIEQENDYGALVIKNISAAPLDIDPGQLTDRFVRADQSRTTEGSGLGLCIAQSLTTMQDGIFNIEIDGDLFKVTIQMPLFGDCLGTVNK